MSKPCQQGHHKKDAEAFFVSIFIYSSNDNCVHNKKMIFTKIVITNFQAK